MYNQRLLNSVSLSLLLLYAYIHLLLVSPSALDHNMMVPHRLMNHVALMIRHDHHRLSIKNGSYSPDDFVVCMYVI